MDGRQVISSLRVVGGVGLENLTASELSADMLRVNIVVVEMSPSGCGHWHLFLAPPVRFSCPFKTLNPRLDCILPPSLPPHSAVRGHLPWKPSALLEGVSVLSCETGCLCPCRVTTVFNSSMKPKVSLSSADAFLLELSLRNQFYQRLY